MNVAGPSQERKYDREDTVPFISPYVEISDDYGESQSSNFKHPLLEQRGSINSFLGEAEIISPSSEIITANAYLHMRNKLKHYFMNPVDKWRINGRFPWKFCIQTLIIFTATIQVCNFGVRSYDFVTRHDKMTAALSQFLLKDWSPDGPDFPPEEGPYAVFTIPEFYENINYVIRQYTKVSILPIGLYAYDNINGSLSSMVFCAKHFNGSIVPENSTVSLHGKPIENCITIPPLYPYGSDKWNSFDLQSFLYNFTLDFKILIKAKLHFILKTVFIKSMTKHDITECYKLNITVSYDNSEHDSQFLISLKIRSRKLNCIVHSKAATEKENLHYLSRQIFNCIVIILCLMSMILYLRSLFNGYKLSRDVAKFFKQYYHIDIPAWEHLDFIDFWYVNIVASDILLIFGIFIKCQIEEKSAERDEYVRCTILLGVSNLLLWLGLLRYLSFFPKYNMLILTVKRALPDLLRFTTCAVFLYMGFCFCGWIVLAPYHAKFRTLSMSSECLYALMNGDDLFATFALTDSENKLIWYFSRVYLYLFLLLFICTVISLFISVILDAFETLKIYYSTGFPPKTTVEIFLATDECSSFPTASFSPEQNSEILSHHLHIPTFPS